LRRLVGAKLRNKSVAKNTSGGQVSRKQLAVRIEQASRWLLPRVMVTIKTQEKNAATTKASQRAQRHPRHVPIAVTTKRLNNAIPPHGPALGSSASRANGQFTASQYKAYRKLITAITRSLPTLSPVKGASSSCTGELGGEYGVRSRMLDAA
jgi:hypothetical protein